MCEILMLKWFDSDQRLIISHMLLLAFQILEINTIFFELYRVKGW